MNTVQFRILYILWHFYMQDVCANKNIHLRIIKFPNLTCCVPLNLQINIIKKVKFKNLSQNIVQDLNNGRETTVKKRLHLIPFRSWLFLQIALRPCKITHIHNTMKLLPSYNAKIQLLKLALLYVATHFLLHVLLFCLVLVLGSPNPSSELHQCAKCLIYKTPLIYYIFEFPQNASYNST